MHEMQAVSCVPRTEQAGECESGFNWTEEVETGDGIGDMEIHVPEIMDARPGIGLLSRAVDFSADFRWRIQG